MKILLINPPSRYLEKAYGVKQRVRFGFHPPLGLGYIAAYLEMDHHEVRILDALALALNLEETLAQIRQFGPDLIGLTTVTNYAEMAHQLSVRIKQMMPRVTIVLGGAHATYYYSEILSDMPALDHVIYGEADAVIRDYVRYVDQPERLAALPGLVYRDASGRAVVNPPADVPHRLDDIPLPAWHLFDMSLYRPLPLQYRKKPFFTLITSRGCFWRKCKFCFQGGHAAGQYRRHSPERVVREMEILSRQFGIREIAFWDDTFVMNLKWLTAFKDLLREKHLSMSWVASGRVNTMTEDMVRAVRDAGCWSIFIGVESGNQELLDTIDKGITLEQARNVFAITNKIGIETRGAFMLGLPGETPAMGRRTIDFAIALNPTYAAFYAAHPFKGTQLYDMALQTGTILDSRFQGMSKVTYVPAGYADAAELERMVRTAYLRFYLRPRVIWRTLCRMFSLGSVREIVWGFLLFWGLASNRKSVSRPTANEARAAHV